MNTIDFDNDPLINILSTQTANTDKFRRMTMTPSELLYSTTNHNNATFTKYSEPGDVVQNKTFVKEVCNEDINDTNNNDTNRKDSLNETFCINKNMETIEPKAAFLVPNVPLNDNQMKKNGDVCLNNDRMTQSLFIDVNAPSLRKSSLNGTSDLPRVPSAPSLK